MAPFLYTSSTTAATLPVTAGQNTLQHRQICLMLVVFQALVV